jgi:hypothetical protein
MFYGHYQSWVFILLVNKEFSREFDHRRMTRDFESVSGTTNKYAENTKYKPELS